MAKSKKKFRPKEKREPKIWSLDTEDDSKGGVTLINFFDGETHHTFRTRDEAVHFLETCKSNIQIWCTNLGYDLVNLLGEWLAICEITYISSRVISAKVVGTQITFRDSLNHWKISVAEMGKRIGLEKLEADLFDDRSRKISDAEFVRRCQRDSEITYRFVITMKEKYESIGAKLKATIGSTALEFYYSKFGARPLAPVCKQQDIEFMLAGYYGGRTEIFFNRPVTGRIRYFDFNSLYPAVMRENFFPVLKKPRRTRKPDIEKHEGIIDATVRAPNDLPVPYLPFRHPDSGSLIFPLGEFRGRWTYFEIREAKKLGYEVLKIHTSLEFQSGRFQPFTTFVDELFSQRLKAQEQGDTLMSDTLKLNMNNLYGKFAQGNEVTKLIPFERAKLKHGDTIFGNMISRKVVGEYPKHTNVIWAAYATAFARHKLWLGMKKVTDKGGLLIYCDTDSIIFESSKAIFKSGKKLGELKSEGDFEYCHFKLPKLYKLVERKNAKAIYRAKGVPRKAAEEFFERGKVSFERPYKLKESLRRNLSVKRVKKIIPNFWDTTEKETRKIYDKRIVEKSGHTRPLTIAAKRSKAANKHAARLS